MAAEPKVCVSVYLDQAVISRMDEWAKKLGVSRSKVAGLLLETGVQDDAWILDILTSRMGLAGLSFARKLAGASTAVPSEAGTVGGM